MIFSKVNYNHKFSRFCTVLALLLVTGLLSSCDLAKSYTKSDRDAGLAIQDYRDAFAPRDIEEADANKASSRNASIPKLQPYIASAPETIKPMPIVSVSVNQSVPLRDILFELAKQADYDLELDPRIQGSIIFTARNRPLDQVVERIASISGLRFNFENDVMRVELDTPYHKVYKVEYLNYIRTNAGSVRNSIAVVSGEGADTGSEFEAKSESNADFWGELEDNLKQIIDLNEGNILRTSQSPRLEVSTPSEPGGDAVLNVASLPVDAEEQDAPKFTSSFTLNRQAGLVSVYANEKTQKQVDEYLTLLRRSATSQVLIEAKILEVSLQDEYASGIDWQALNILSGEGVLEFGSNALREASATGLGTALAGTRTNVTSRPGTTLAPSNNFVVGFVGNDIQALVQAISGFGTVRALASPRLTVLNNQSALLNVARNRVFFEVDIDVTVDEGTQQTDIDSDIRNIPEGILVSVQPSIDLDRETISMAVRPTITRVVREVSDPAIQFVTASAGITGVESLVPEINVQEIDSVIQMRSGQPIVMGGLLQDRVATTEEAVPVLGETPLFGSLFRNNDSAILKTELVILLKATIIQPEGNIHQTDRDLYKLFSGDRRPFKL